MNSKKIGFIGLGKMGQNMVLHLLAQGISVVGYNRTREVTEVFVKEVQLLPSQKGTFIPAYTPQELVSQLSSPTKAIWLMVPNGKPVDDVISQLLLAGITNGDTIIDGGNCFYKDSVRRGKELAGKGITFIDCGTSGGLEGAIQGACLMVGGDKQSVLSLSWLFDALASKPLGGWNYMGASGAGHFVKMVHNGVEYVMNQALGEGFELLARSPFDLDLETVAKTWTQGSVIRGWLTQLLARAFAKDPRLDAYHGKVGGGETGQWTLDAAKETGIDAILIADAVNARKLSQTHPTFAGKVVSALRFEYGGHKETQ